MNNLRTTDGRTSFFMENTSLRSCRTRGPAKVGKSAKKSIIARFLFFSPNCSGASFTSDSLSCYSSAQVFVILKMRFFSSGRTSVLLKTTTYIRTLLLSSWMLWVRWEVWCLLVTFVAQMELYSNKSFSVDSQMSTAPYTLCWWHQIAVCYYLQIRGTSSLILPTNFCSGSCVWTSCPSCGLCLKSCRIRPFTTFFLTYSLKALHVETHGAYHMTINIRLMSCSNLRVDAHVLLVIGCFYLRCDRNGLSVATHMDSEAPDQDCSYRSRWFTVRPREFITLDDVSIATGKGEPGLARSCPPAIRILFWLQCNMSPASFSRKKSEKAIRCRRIARAKISFSRSGRVVGPLVPSCSSFCHCKHFAVLHPFCCGCLLIWSVRR